MVNGRKRVYAQKTQDQVEMNEKISRVIERQIESLVEEARRLVCALAFTPLKVVFIDTEWSCVNNALGKRQRYLREAALVRSDGKVLLSWINRANQNLVAAAAEAKELRRELEKHIDSETVLVEWSICFCDWDLLAPFCSTMPDRARSIRLTLAVKRAFPDLPTFTLDKLHPRLFPDSPWLYQNHSAMPDAQMAREFGHWFVERARSVYERELQGTGDELGDAGTVRPSKRRRS